MVSAYTESGKRLGSSIQGLLKKGDHSTGSQAVITGSGYRS